MNNCTNFERETLNRQQTHWEKTFENNPELFGEEASKPARKTAELFKKEGKTQILELGGGQGRDTIFFVQNGFQITTLDYTETSISTIREKSTQAGISSSVVALRHDIRNPLPFEDTSFDACYSHMLFCMALTTSELESLVREIWRILKPEGLCVYTVRHTGDCHYGTGIDRGDDMCEIGGFIVHFFSREKVEQLAKGFEIVSIDTFEEGELPRKLFQVTLRKIET